MDCDSSESVLFKKGEKNEVQDRGGRTGFHRVRNEVEWNNPRPPQCAVQDNFGKFQARK